MESIRHASSLEHVVKGDELVKQRPESFQSRPSDLYIVVALVGAHTFAVVATLVGVVALVAVATLGVVLLVAVTVVTLVVVALAVVALAVVLLVAV